MARDPRFDILFEPGKIGSGTIATAIYSGQEFARSLGIANPEAAPLAVRDPASS